jgi:hypothetical protein
MLSVRRLLAIVTVSFAAYSLASGDLHAQGKTALRSTPEATVALHAKAVAAEDLPGIFAGLSPDSQQRLLSLMVKQTHQFALRSPKEDLEPLTTMLKAFGLDPQKAAAKEYEPEVFADAKDKAQCLSDLITWHELREGRPLPPRAVFGILGDLARLKDAELSEVIYEGTTARGVLLIPKLSKAPKGGKPRDEDDGLHSRDRQKVAFAKVGDEWRMDLVTTRRLRGLSSAGLTRQRFPPAKKVAVRQATPEEAFETLRAAMAGRDWRTAFLLVSDADRCRLLAKAAGSGTDEVRKILEKHGLAVADLLVGDPQRLKEKVACFRELMEYQEKGDEAQLAADLAGEWSNITAMGKSETRGKQTFVRIKKPPAANDRPEVRAFVEIGGKWRFDEIESLKIRNVLWRESVKRHPAWRSEDAFNSSLTSSIIAPLVFSVAPTTVAMAGTLPGSDDGVLRIVRFPSFETLVDLKKLDPPIVEMSFSPDGALLAVGHEGRDAKDGRLRLFEIQQAKFVRDLEGHKGVVTVLRWSVDGKTLYGGDFHGRLYAWNPTDGVRRWSSKRPSGGLQFITSLAVSPDGKRLASEADSDVAIWDAHSGRRVALVSGHDESVRQVQFSPDGSLLATASKDETVKIWDAKNYRWQRTLNAHEHGARAVAFSPDGKLLASAGQEWTVKIWDVATGRLRDTLTAHTEHINHVQFSLDGETLISQSDKRVVLWDMRLVSK